MSVSSGDHFSSWAWGKKSFLEELRTAGLLRVVCLQTHSPPFPALFYASGGHLLQAVVPVLLCQLAPESYQTEPFTRDMRRGGWEREAKVLFSFLFP